MKPKTTKTLYWIFTIILALLLLLDGIGGVTRQQDGQEALRHLGYPMYLLSIVGFAKLLAVVAILQNRFTTIKEWAYAGVVINHFGAAASHAFAGDPAFQVIFPVLMLVIVFVPYFLWKKLAKA